MPAPILTRSKPAKRKRARIPLSLGLFGIVEDDDEEIGVSFGSPEDVGDGVGAERFSSAMVVEGEEEGEGEGAKKPKSHRLNWHRDGQGESLNVPHFGNTQPDLRAERRLPRVGQLLQDKISCKLKDE